MNIYDTFAQYYEADFGDFAADLPLYLALAKQTGGPILDLMCGTGRVTLPLVQAGYTVTGVDASEAMLALARTKCPAEIAPRLTLLHDDARVVRLAQRHFRLALIPFNSFVHFHEVGDQLAVLTNVRRSLKRGGALVIDLSNADPAQLLSETGVERVAGVYDLDGRKVVKFVTYRNTFATQMSEVTFRYEDRADTRDVINHKVSFQARWFYRYELEHLLKLAGFRVRGVYGTYDFGPYVDGCAQLIMIASADKLQP